jgi:hypothetical protein
VKNAAARIMATFIDRRLPNCGGQIIRNVTMRVNQLGSSTLTIFQSWPLLPAG